MTATQTELDLVWKKVRKTDPETSTLAAIDSIRTANKGRALVMLALTAQPDGLTDFELAEVTGWQQTSIGKRRGELRDAGFVVDSGLRRPSPSGSNAIVWKISHEETGDTQ